MKKAPLIFFLLMSCYVFSYGQEKPTACPQVSVDGPAKIPKTGETVTFTAKLHGDTKTLNLEYKWAASASKIIAGQGTSQVNILFDPNYSLTITVEIKGLPEGCPGMASETLYWDPAPQAVLVDTIGNGCPKVSVETSFISVIDGYPMTFTAKIIEAAKKSSTYKGVPPSGGGVGLSKLKYKWTVSGGEITEGQGTPEIRVDTLGYAGEEIKATLIVRGFPKGCKNRASATGFVKPKPYLN